MLVLGIEMESGHNIGLDFSLEYFQVMPPQDEVWEVFEYVKEFSEEGNLTIHQQGLSDSRMKMDMPLIII